jgi:hypothetical protein
MSIFTRAWKWLKHALADGEQKVLPIAIAVTEGIKTALESGVPDFVANMVETLFPQVHNLPDQLLKVIKENIVKVLAAELAIKALEGTPTDEEIKDFEAAVLNAFGLHDKKSKLYTELAVQLAQDIDTFTEGGNKDRSFAEWVIEIEKEYKKMIALEAESEAAA